ncbi:MAG: tRNA lysidine(34) synthetase TilS [Chlamydiota bacterium]
MQTEKALKHLQQIFRSHLSGDSTIILGYSGGIDSSALLWLLAEYSKKWPLNLHVVHVDHGWRSTSGLEALELKKYIENLGLPFHLERITTVDASVEKNLEDKYRLERLKIFRKFYTIFKAEALLLAHQKDDLAETVFKRIFEGASLRKLIGLKESSFYEEMKVLRPLLSFSKDELYDLIIEKQVPYIIDPTNEDINYLRARQRAIIVPDIERQFGKRSFHHLCRLSNNLSHYEGYMNRKIQKYKDLMVEGPLGSYLKMSSLHPMEFLEFEHFIRSVCEEKGVVISQVSLETLWEKVSLRESNKKVLIQNLQILLDRDFLFFMPNVPLCFNQEIIIESLPCSFTHLDCIWKIEENPKIEKEILEFSWEDFWKGSVNLRFEKAPLKIQQGGFLTSFNGKSLKQMYIKWKIPAFLRTLCPSFFQYNRLMGHPIFGNSSELALKDIKNYRLSIFRNKDFDSLK